MEGEREKEGRFLEGRKKGGEDWKGAWKVEGS